MTPTITNDWRLVPVSEAIVEFLQATATPEGNTWRAYSYALELLYDHLTKSGQTPTLEQLTRASIEQLVEELFAQGKRPATVAHRLDIWKAFSKFCAVRFPGFMDNSRRIRRPVIVNQGRKNFSPECIEKLRQVVRLHACTFLAARNALILELALRAGLREVEICNLRMSNIEDGMLVNVRRKGRKFFTIPMHKRIVAALDEYMQERDALLKVRFLRRKVTQEQLMAMPLLLPYELTTCAPGDIKPLNPKTVYRLFVECGKAAGLKKCTPHMAKHTFTNDLLRVADLPTASRASGHSNIATTMQYLGRDLADLERVLDAID
jgi:integrase/recombinase XerC